jgi:dihydrofolate reductase
MRKIIFESSISLDGFIEGPNGELDWLVFEQEAADAETFLCAFDTIFYGRKSYERLGLPPVPGIDISEAERNFVYALHGMRKYVFSRTKKHVKGNGMVISQNLEAEVKRIREERGKDIWLFGGSDLLKTFADLDLVDEYLLSVHPVLLGRGKYLFASGRTPRNLNLINKQNLASGVVVLRYLPESRLKDQ